jgi:hypothetical protein
MEIKVINHNAEVLRGRYDGKDYVFAPEKAITLPLDAATHIFGLGDEDKSSYLNKLGLLIPGRHTLEDALLKLEKITFMEGRTVFADEEGFEAADEEEEGEGKSRRKRTGGRPHVSDPGGATGAGSREPPPANP